MQLGTGESVRTPDQVQERDHFLSTSYWLNTPLILIISKRIMRRRKAKGAYQ